MFCFVLFSLLKFKCVHRLQLVNNSVNKRSLGAAVVGVNVQCIATSLERSRESVATQYRRKGFGCTACPGFFLAHALFGRLGSELSDGMETERTRHSAGKDMDEVNVVARCMRGAFQYCGMSKESLFQRVVSTH